MQKSKVVRAQLRAVEEILRRWDPIGVFAQPERAWPRDEYDSYAPLVLKQLLADARADALTNCLTHLAVTRMGLPAYREREQEIAEELAAWWAEQDQSRQTVSRSEPQSESKSTGVT